MSETLQSLSLEIDLLQKKLKLLKEIKEQLEEIHRLRDIYIPQQYPFYPTYPTYPYPIIYGGGNTVDAWPGYESNQAMHYPPHMHYGTSDDFIAQFENDAD